MANYTSATYDAQTLAASRADKIGDDAVLNGGQSTPYQYTWTVPAGTLASDTVSIGYLPAGVTVGIGSTIFCNQSGVNAFGIGFPGDATALAAAVPPASGITLIKPTSPSYKNESRQVVTLTLSSVVTAGTIITISLAAQRGE